MLSRNVFTCSLAAQFCFTMAAWADVSSQSDSDRRLTSEVRQALELDIDLGALNLGATVRDNVATIWGSVPSRDLADRAGKLAGKVPGVGKVINQLSVESPEDPLNEFLKRPRRSVASETAPEKKPIVPVPPDEKKSVRSAHGPVPVWHPAPEAKPASRPAADEPVTMPLIQVPVIPPLTAPTPSIRPAAALDTGDLGQAIAALQKSNERLRGVQPEIRGGTVYLRGNVAAWEDLFVLARGISRLPGVDRVVIDGVKTR